MLLLRYQRQRGGAGCGEEGGAKAAPHRARLSDRDLKGEHHRAATRSTLVCIWACGAALLVVGGAVVGAGLTLAVDPAPWLVVGPTCLVLGVLVLLLSVEIVLKLRKIAGGASSSSSRASSEAPPPPAKASLLPKDGRVGPRADALPPVLIHPPTPLQHLDPANMLPVEVVQHR